MSYIMNRVYVILIALCCLTNALAGPPDIHQRVESLRNSLGVPGVSIAIAENGQVVLAKGYGIRNWAARESWAAHDFPHGRTGKAFTVAALATLFDQGKIKWDDKVIDHSRTSTCTIRGSHAR